MLEKNSVKNVYVFSSAIYQPLSNLSRLCHKKDARNGGKLVYCLLPEPVVGGLRVNLDEIVRTTNFINLIKKFEKIFIGKK